MIKENPAQREPGWLDAYGAFEKSGGVPRGPGGRRRRVMTAILACS